MKVPHRRGAALATLILLLAPCAGAAAPVPPFDVAYRAWEVVTELARLNADPAISGTCGKTFRPFVIPGLRRQTPAEQDVAAVACVEAARSACTSAKLRLPDDIGKKCVEFR